jgi:hypothetical protein
MFFDGYMAAPPTITVFSLAATGATKDADIMSAANAPAKTSGMRLDINVSLDCLTGRRISDGQKRSATHTEEIGGCGLVSQSYGA